MKSLNPFYVVLMGVILTGIIHSTPIRVGMTAALSGPSEKIGQSLLKGIEPTIEYINEEGGINGQPLELVLYDDSYDPKQTVLNTSRLLEEEQVDLLFSFVGTSTTEESLPLLSKHNKLLFFPFTGANFLYEHPNNRFLVNEGASYWQETSTIVDFFVTQELKKIAVYYQHDAFGQSGLKGVTQALKNHSLELGFELNYERGKQFTDNFYQDASTLLESEPDAIICISTYEAASGLIKAVRQSSNVPIATISFSDPKNIPQLIGTDVRIFNKLYYSQVTPQETELEDLETYKEITKQDSYDPLIYKGYKNTIQLAEILRKYTLTELADNHSLIQKELPTGNVSLYESQRKDWVLIEE